MWFDRRGARACGGGDQHGGRHHSLCSASHNNLSAHVVVGGRAHSQAVALTQLHCPSRQQLVRLPLTHPTQLLCFLIGAVLMLQTVQDSGALGVLRECAAVAWRMMCGASMRRTQRLAQALRGALTVFVLLLVIAMLTTGATASKLPDSRTLQRLHNGVGMAARLVRARPIDVYMAQAASMSGVALGGDTLLDASNARELMASIESSPACISAPISARAGSKRCTALNLLDSGAGVHCLNSRRYMISGTERANTTAIATANGVIVPPTMCDARIPLRTIDGQQTSIRLDGALLLPHSHHKNLISLGKLAREQRVRVAVGAAGKK